MKKYILKSIVALCFIALSTNAWGWWYVPTNMFGWGMSEQRASKTQMSNTNYVTFYAVPTGTYNFKLAVDKDDNLVWGFGSLTNGTPSIITSLTTGTGDGNNTITVNQTCNITFHMTDGEPGGSWACTVTASEPSCPVKANFNNTGTWTTKTFYSNKNGTVGTTGKYGGCSSYNLKRSDTESTNSGDGEVFNTNISVEEGLQNSDDAVFTYDPSTGTMTIRKANSITHTNYFYLDTTNISTYKQYKYLAIGYPNYSIAYQLGTKIANTKLYYGLNGNNDWGDGSYYAYVAGSSAWDNKNGWGPSNVYGWDQYSAPYFEKYNMAASTNYVISMASGSNGAALSITPKGTAASGLNSSQTIKYSISRDGGSTYAEQNSGVTPAQISIASYKFEDGTYDEVTESNASISVNQSSTHSTSVDVAYTGATTLSYDNMRDGYTFIGWYDAASGGSTHATSYNPTDDETVYARFTAHRYDILFDANDDQYPGEASGTMTKISDVVYDQSQTLTSNVFTRTGYTFAGWATSPTGLKEYNDGASVSNLSSEDDADVTLYALWTVNPYRVDVASVDHVTISATTPSIAEGGNANANYGSTVSLSYASVESGYAFGYWKVYKTDDESTTVTVTNNQFTMPAYPVTVSAVMANDLKVWCAPEDLVFSAPNGGDHLTSTKGVYVHSTSAAGNLLNIKCSDFGSATEMEIAYLNADAADAEVDKASSLFRLYDAAVTAAIDAMSSTVSISASRVLDTDFSIWYKPNTYGTTNHYKLRLTLKKGDLTLKTETKDLYGRSLPEEFVIALKDGDYWYALPNNLQTSSGSSHSTPIKITVDNTSNPTTAVYTATTTVYKGQNRQTPTGNMHGIRFTSDDSNHLQGSTSSGINPMWLASSNSDANQSFYLKSEDFGAYVVTLDPTSIAKQMGIYTVSSKNYIGYISVAEESANIYFLPITNKYTPRDATAYEWGEHGVIVEADMTDVASATMHIDGASPTAATVTGINGSLGSTKYAKVDGGALNVGAVANDGKLLYIHWKNSGGTEIAASQITMPCVIAANATMSDLSIDKAIWAKREVHILPGDTLTADGNSFESNEVTVPTMYVYPGATLKITDGKLITPTLRLRSGWTRAGTKDYNVARVHIADDAQLSKSDFTLDYDIYDSDEGTHYYPIAVPYKSKVKKIDYLDPILATASTYGTHYAIKRYNGARRAEYGAIDENWELVPDEEESEDVYIRPGEGYIMTGVGIPAYGGCIIRFPLDANDNWTNDGEKASYSGFDKNVIAVTHHTGAAATTHKRHEGWNMLANPYMACFDASGNTSHSETDGFIKGHFTITGDPEDPYGWTENDDNIYVSVPTHDFSEYIQKEITEAELLPGWSFFIQAADDGNVTFAVAGQQTSSDLPIYAPKRKEAENMPTVKTGIVLSSETASDKTTLLISDKYSDEYEIGADLEKMFGNGYTLATYSLNNDTRLAFNAMSTSDAKSAIPIGVRIPADGSYTFSLNERYADADIERLDLIDYETSEVTNLMTSDYTFNATRSQNDERFAINITPRAQTPTDIGDTGIDDTNGVRKILLNETIYIIRDGRVYDATGKRVTTINK